MKKRLIALTFAAVMSTSCAVTAYALQQGDSGTVEAVSAKNRYSWYQDNAAAYDSLEEIAEDYIAGNITFNELAAAIGLYKQTPAEASGTVISISDSEGISITVDTDGSISSDTGNIKTDRVDRDVAEIQTAAAEKQTTAAEAEKQTTMQQTQQQTTVAEKQTVTVQQIQAETATVQQTQPVTTKQAETTTAHTHTWVTVSGYAATCSTSGRTDGTKCSSCGAMEAAQQTIPPFGHNWVNTSAATCTEPGYMTCTRCGESMVSQDALGHDWYDVAYGYIIHYKDPQYVCNVCGYMTTDVNDMIDHCAIVCGGGYYVDFYVIDYEECVGEDAAYADDWRYVGTKCSRCGAWQ